MNTTLKEISPEEKLLNIIESSQNKKAPSKKKKKKKVFSFFKKGPPVIYKIIFALCIATILFAGYHLGVKTLDTMKFHDIKLGYVSSSEPALGSPAKTKIDIRTGLPVNIATSFQPVHSKSGFALVGILWTDKPQAIIEEASTNKTYIVNEGDMVKDYQVIKINQNQVELNSERGNEILN